MIHNQLDTPILLVGFIRFETAQKVFDEIRKAKPRQFFLAVGGPREGVKEDEARCQKTREIAQQVDWDCEVHTLFQEKNLGCGVGTVAAINWLFEHVEEGIIFDDDCVPDQSFFRFCQELLAYYKGNEKIMHISGDNFQHGTKRGSGSYYFSKYTHNWGWATWRRAWKHNDFELLPPELRRGIWDKQWLQSVANNGGLAVLPNVNLVTNIGSGADATHTQEDSPYMNLPITHMTFPLIHPRKIRRDVAADWNTYRTLFEGTMKSFLYKEVRRILPVPVQRVLTAPLRKVRKSRAQRTLLALYLKYKDFTMIPERTFRDNLELVARFRNIEGCIVECGTWKGGMIAAIAELLGNEKQYYLFDSFEGLPAAKEIDGKEAVSWQSDTDSPYYFDNRTADIHFSEQAMKLSGAEKYTITKGWFKDTLPKFPLQKIAILRLDGDWYESTMECLENLYEKVSAGGIIILDDYYTWDGCARAVHEFLSNHKLSDRIYTGGKGLCYILKK